jgi:hypothetical protein
MAQVLLSAGTSVVNLVIGASDALVGALATAAQGLRVVAPIALGIIHSDVEWLGMVLIFLGTILAVPLFNVLHSFIDDASGFFVSWKANRTAAVNAADGIHAPVKIRQFFIKPLLVFIFGLFYLVIALFRAIWHKLPWLIITIFFVFVFTYIEVYSGATVDMVQVHLNLASSTINTAGAYAGAGSDVFNVALPAFNAVWQNQLNTAVTFTNYMQSVSSGGNGVNLFRNLQVVPEVATVAVTVGKSIQSAAVFSTVLNKIRLIVLAFGLVEIIPLLPYILPELDFIVQRLMCLLLGMDNACNVREVLEFVLISKINDIIDLINDLGANIAQIEIACDATELSGGPSCTEPGAFPADCTGMFQNIQSDANQEASAASIIMVSTRKDAPSSAACYANKKETRRASDSTTTWCIAIAIRFKDAPIPRERSLQQAIFSTRKTLDPLATRFAATRRCL